MSESRTRNHGKPRIVPGLVPSDSRVLNFAFKHLHMGHQWFALSKCSTDFFEALFRQLKFYEEMSVDEFVQDNNKENRHIIPWETTNLPEGFTHLEPNVAGTETARQFCLHELTPHSEHKWRVYGFIDGETFYVVWLDPEHRLEYINKDKKRKGER